MAKIYLTGQPFVECDENEANRVREMWAASKEKGKEYLLPKSLSVMGRDFEGKDIRGFDIISYASKETEASEYNVADNGPEKEKVRAFEKEFESWKSQHPEVTEWHKYHFLQAKGFIKMGKYRPNDIEFTKNNPEKHKEYLEYLKLFSSLQTLRYYREKVAAGNDPDFESKRVQKFKEMRKQVFGR